MGIFSSGKRRRTADQAGRKAFRSGKQVSAKHAESHAAAVRRQAEFKARKQAARRSK